MPNITNRSYNILYETYCGINSKIQILNAFYQGFLDIQVVAE